MNHARTLTVTSRHGLSNRLRMLLSGSVLAQHTDRAFAMLWSPTSGCAATFPQLFQNGWNVKDERAPANVKELDLTLQKWSEFPDLTASPAPDLFVAYYGWLLEPRLYAQHAALMPQCANLMDELEPIPEIQDRINSQREQFRGSVIGIHLRRGDFVQYHPDVSNSLEFAIRAVEHFLERASDAQVFLCTDDGAPLRRPRQRARYLGIREKFSERFGTRLLTTKPRSLDRAQPEAMQDALVDLWLLRQTNFFVGTARSSFSELAVFGRNVPSAITHNAESPAQRMERFLQWTGLPRILDEMTMREFGERYPVRLCWHRRRIRAQARVAHLFGRKYRW